MNIKITDGGRRRSGLRLKGENDCVVRALAIYTGLPYKKIYKAITSLLSLREHFESGMRPNAVSQHGVDLEILEPLLRHVFASKKVYGVAGITLRQLARKHPDKIMLLAFRVDHELHCATMKHGTLYDSGDSSLNFNDTPTRIIKAYTPRE